MVPVLGVVDERASHHAQLLGEAFQLTNFVRDVAEDLVRGRVYLPLEDLDRFGVSVADLAPGPVGEHVRELVRFEVARARSLYAEAEPGIAMLDPTSRDCVRAAFELYGGILDEIERNHHDVVNQRAVVPGRRRLRIAAPRLLAARRARERVRPGRRGHPTTSTSTSTT
jgi:phytoene synthase